MKNWNTPEIQELNLSNTELGTKRTDYPDKVIYSVELQTNLYAYSGVGKKAEDEYHTTPVGDENP